MRLLRASHPRRRRALLLPPRRAAWAHGVPLQVYGVITSKYTTRCIVARSYVAVISYRKFNHHPCRCEQNCAQKYSWSTELLEFYLRTGWNWSWAEVAGCWMWWMARSIKAMPGSEHSGAAISKGRVFGSTTLMNVQISPLRCILNKIPSVLQIGTFSLA